MSKIDELIEKFCPDGVGYMKLGDVVEILDSKRKPIAKDRRIPGPYPYYGANGIQDYVTDFIFDGKFLLLGEDGSVINKDGSPVLNWAEGKIWVNNHAHILAEKKDKALLRFLFFALSEIDVTKVVKGNIPKITQQNLRGFRIPIPPISIQEEIVKILDTFTTLEAELEAELEARTRQYEFYRNQLLAFEGKEVEWKTLGEVGKIKRGVAFTKKQSIFGNYPVVANAPVPISFHNVANRSGECVVIARSGANAGLVSYWNEEFFLTDAFSIHPDNELLNTKFLYYFLKNLQREIHLMKKGFGVPHVRASDFEIYYVPIPPLAEQERIVDILDKFDALVNDISVGLPAEIKARRQQYEYYRGTLLSFKEVQKN